MSKDLPTPLPVGSPHLTKPPMFDRWGAFHKGDTQREQRAYSRRDVQCSLWLIEAGDRGVVRCKTADISDAGLYGISPIGYGLAVGQRYEVRIADTSNANQLSVHLAPSLGYATVTRTQMDVDDDGGHRIGFGLKFDVPQLLPV